MPSSANGKVRRETRHLNSKKNRMQMQFAMITSVQTVAQYSVFYHFRASVSEAGDEKREGPLKKYHVEKSFADRRYKVSSARTYFYLNEASCERNMDIFIRCLEAVASESRILFLALSSILKFFLVPETGIFSGATWSYTKCLSQSGLELIFRLSLLNSKLNSKNIFCRQK